MSIFGDVFGPGGLFERVFGPDEPAKPELRRGLVDPGFVYCSLETLCDMPLPALKQHAADAHARAEPWYGRRCETVYATRFVLDRRSHG
jgi:hypothetical protein